MENSYRNDQKKNDELKRQRDEVLYHKEEIGKEKTDIAKQLNEVLAENFQAAIVELETERQARPLKRLKESETVKDRTPKCKTYVNQPTGPIFVFSYNFKGFTSTDVTFSDPSKNVTLLLLARVGFSFSVSND